MPEIIKDITGIQSTVLGEVLPTNDIKRIGYKTVIIGSSITQHASLWGATKISNCTRGWMSWLNYMVGQCLVYQTWKYTNPNDGATYLMGSNKGYSGQTSAEILSRIEDIKALKADIYIIQQGTNDLGFTGGTEIPIQTTIDNCLKTAKLLRETGAIVIMTGEPARTVGAGGIWVSGGDARKKRHMLNKAKRAFALKNKGVFYVNPDRDLVDPANVDGEPYTGSSFDGTHYVAKGAYLWAKPIADVLLTVLPKINRTIVADDLYSATYNPRGNLVVNPRLTGGGTSWTKATTGTGVSATYTSNADGTLTVVITTTGAGAANAEGSVTLQQTAVAKTGQTNEAYFTMCGIKSITGPAVFAAQGYLRASATGQTSLYAFDMERYTNASFPLTLNAYWPVQSTSISGMLKTPSLVCEYNNTDLRAGIYIYVDTSVAGTTTVILDGIGLYQDDLPWDILGVTQTSGLATAPSTAVS